TELWDLMNILSNKNDSVLGSPASYWRKRNMIPRGLNLIMGKEKMDFFDKENWEWMRNPFPPAYENPLFATLRMKERMKDDDFVYNKSFFELTPSEQQRVGNLLSRGFYEHYNPYIRHVIRREREYLENKVNPETGESYLQKINVELFGESDDEALKLGSYLQRAYEYAEAFCKELGKRNKGAGFLKTLLLKRIGSSIEAGKNTGYKMLNEWNTYVSDVVKDEEYRDEEELQSTSNIKDLSEEETQLLQSFVKELESTNAVDPKYEKTIELLKHENWIERGTIIFSQYFDTTNWIAEKISKEFQDESIGVYAGGNKSGIYENGKFKTRDKETIKEKVRTKEIRILEIGRASCRERV